MGKKETNGKLNSTGNNYEMVVENENDYRCGVGNMRPDWLQSCANMKVFTLVLSMVHVFGSMNFTYYTAVISDIERQFGLSSSMSGFIKNVDNIGYLCAVLIVSHFFRYASKPKVFSIATAGTSLAIALFAFPHFIYGVDEEIGPIDTNITSVLKNNTPKFDICDVDREEFSKECNSRSLLRPFNTGALVFFVVSELIQGIMQSPKFTLSLTYMDDNAKKKSPIYFGVLFATRSFSPILGFLLGAWTTKLYVDLSDPGISRKDPRWVGAWWLGFLICAACSIVWAPIMAFFPKHFNEENKLSADEKNKQVQESKPATARELPKALWRLIRNPVLLCLITASCFNFYLMGFATFTPKYLQNHFGMTASTANIFTGVVSACSYSMGPIVSGRIMATKSITPAGALKFIMVINSISAIGFMVMGFLECPKEQWHGDISLLGNSLDAPCNSNCSCDPFMYTPVCGPSDGINYFSPCFAGCTSHNGTINGKTIFTNCSCTDDGIAVEGVCEKNCLHILIPYVIIMIISKFSASMTFVPYMTVLMRSVSFADKALALGFSGAILMIVAFPAPFLFGAVVDSACLFQQSSCTRKGACLLYDQDKFRFRLHSFAAIVKFGAFCMYVFTWLVLRRKERLEKTSAQKEDKQAMDPMLSTDKETVQENLTSV